MFIISQGSQEGDLQHTWREHELLLYDKDKDDPWKAELEYIYNYEARQTMVSTIRML